EELVELLERIRATPAKGRIVPDRVADIVEFLALTGLRLQEASLMRVDDVRTGQRIVSVRPEIGKRGGRVLQMPDDLIDLAERWVKGRVPSEPLLPLRYAGVASLMQRWSKRLGAPRLHAHAVRHTFG